MASLSKRDTNTSVILIIIFSFLVGVAGGWYWAQKKTQGIPTSFVPAARQTLSENEPNDSPEKATPITSGATVQGKLETGQDVDFFKIAVDGPSRIQTSLSRLPQQYQLYVYGPNKQLLASSQRQGFLDTTSTLLAPDKGTYYVKVFTNYGITVALPYTLTVTILPPAQ